MIRICLLLTYCIGLCSCQSPAKVELPMEQDKMVKILSDVRIIDEIVKKYDAASQDSVGSVFLDSLFSIHQIDSSQFLQMMKYLQADANRYHEIEKQVHVNLKEYLDGSSK